MGTANSSVKFRFKHTWGADNEVADALSLFSKANPVTALTYAAPLESLPLVYSSIEEHQSVESICKALRQNILAGQAEVNKFQIHNYLLWYFTKKDKRQR